MATWKAGLLGATLALGWVAAAIVAAVMYGPGGAALWIFGSVKVVLIGWLGWLVGALLWGRE